MVRTILTTTTMLMTTMMTTMIATATMSAIVTIWRQGCDDRWSRVNGIRARLTGMMVHTRLRRVTKMIKHGRVAKMILHGRVSTMMVHGWTTAMMVTGCHNIYYHLCIAGSHIVIDLLSFVNHAFVMTVTGSRNVYWQSWVTFRCNANLWS